MKIFWKTPKDIEIAEQALSVYFGPDRIHELRKVTRIAVIDDMNFAPMQNLTSNDFNFSHFRDIPNLDLVHDFPIVLVDLLGIGMELNPVSQGAHVIREIKSRFPDKFVIAYTGGADHQLLAPSVSAADHFTHKDTSIDDWCALLDEAIGVVKNPTVMWKKLRCKLLAEGVTPLQLVILEDTLVTCLLDNPADSNAQLTKKAYQLRLNDNIHAILASFLGTALFSFL